MRAEDVSPDEIGEPRIRVTLANPESPRIAHSPIKILINYGACEPEGVALPIVVTVSKGDSQSSYRVTRYRLVVPKSFIFVPLEGGKHIVLVREAFHNRWQGTCSFDVVGEDLREAF